MAWTATCLPTRAASLNSCSQLGFGVLIRSRKFAVGNRVRAGLIDLGEVGAQLELFANHTNKLAGIVRVRRIAENMLFGIVADGVFVTAEDTRSALPLMRRRGPGIRP